MNDKEVMEKLKEIFGSRISFLAYQIIWLSMTGQPCDITFFNRKPLINVKIHPKISLAIIYGAGPEKLKEMLENIKVSSGEIISINEIWTIHPMPEKGFTEEELQKVDLSKAEEKIGPNGETLREMIRKTYHCESKEEEDYYIRRFLAS